MSGTQKYLEMGVRPQQAELLWQIEEECFRILIEHVWEISERIGENLLEEHTLEDSERIVGIPKVKVDEQGNVLDLKYYVCNNKNWFLDEFPSQIGKITSLRRLIIGGFENNGLYSLPKEIGKLKNLEYLKITEGELDVLPDSIGNLKLLEFLILESYHIRKLPKSLVSLEKLEYLSLMGSKRVENLEIIAGLKNLRTLDLTNTGLTMIPEFIRQLKNLEVLIVKNNRIQELPDWINDMKQLIFLDIRKNTPELHEHVREHLDAYTNDGKRQVLNCMEWSPAYNYYLY